MPKRRPSPELFLTPDGFLFEGPDDLGLAAELIDYPVTIHCPAATEPSCSCEDAAQAVAYLRRIDGKAGVSIWRRKNLESWFIRGAPFTATQGGLIEPRYRGGEFIGALPRKFH